MAGKLALDIILWHVNMKLDSNRTILMLYTLSRHLLSRSIVYIMPMQKPLKYMYVYNVNI